jgi:hypothetical protein
MAKEQRIKRSFNAETGVQSFEFVKEGKTVSVGLDDLFGKGATAKLKAFPNGGILVNLLGHGLNAKVGDTAASPKVDGPTVVTANIGQLQAGNWAAKREGGGGGTSTLLAEAIARVTKHPLEKVVAKLADLSKDEKKGYATNDAVKTAMAEIKAERAAKVAAESKKNAKDAKLDFKI